jgi:hypothetical protein
VIGVDRRHLFRFPARRRDVVDSLPARG